MLEGQAVTVAPEPIHFTTQAHQGSLRIEIKNRSRWWHKVLAFAPVIWMGLAFLIFAGAGLFTLIFTFVINPHGRQLSLLQALVLFTLLIVLTVGLPFLLLRITWWQWMAELLRREVLIMGADQWQLVRDYGLWRSSRLFEAKHLREVRVLVVDLRPSPNAIGRLYFNQPGRVEFRYKKHRVAFAPYATAAEARQIVAAVYRAFPRLQPTPKPAAPAVPAAASPRRWTLTRESGMLKLVLPVRRRWAPVATMVYNLLFSAAWTAFFWFFVPFVNGPRSSGWPVFLVFGGVGAWLCFWSLRELIWHLRGVEVVEVWASGLTLQNVHLMFSRPRAYEAEYITGLRRVDQWGREGTVAIDWRRPGMNGMLAFEYGAATYRFGEALDPAEADELVQLILAQFPRYGRDGLIGPHAE